MRNRHLIPMIFFVLVLAACGAPSPELAVLPTLAELPTLTETPTVQPSSTASHTPTATASATASTTPTPTPSVTPSLTITDTPSPTATFTPSNTPDVGAISLLAQLQAVATVLPPTYQAGGTGVDASSILIATPPLQSVVVVTPPSNTACLYMPPGGFGVVFASDPTLIQQIGCPLGTPPLSLTAPSASQTYERGSMIWVQNPAGVIFVLYDGLRFQRYNDTFTAGTDPESGGETPPSGLIEPVRGFGKVWRTDPAVRSGLGWARAAEAGGDAAIMAFERGTMIYLPQRGETLVLANDPGGNSGSWRAWRVSP